MWKLYLLLIIFVSKSYTQFTQNQNKNLPSVFLENDNLEDSITEIFNHCKCTIFYLCDEENFIIPPQEASITNVVTKIPLRRIRRLRCSNEYYYCCQNRTSATTPPPTIALPQYTQPPREISNSNVGNCGRGKAWASKITDEVPWTVAIFQRKRKPGSGSSFKCGGALIHPKVVLTAQHCVRAATANLLMVVANSEDANQYSRYAVTRRVSNVIKHDQYYSGGLYNDIALLILDVPFDNVNPVCLPEPNQSFDFMTCVAVGWGSIETRSTRRLRKVDLPIVEFSTCQNLLRRTRLGSNFNLHSSFLCAGGEEGQDTCTGDGGSPLMCRQDNRYVQAGIVSWGLECGQKDVPSLYTNVAKYSSWITEKLKNENIIIAS